MGTTPRRRHHGSTRLLKSGQYQTRWTGADGRQVMGPAFDTKEAARFYLDMVHGPGPGETVDEIIQRHVAASKAMREYFDLPDREAAR